MGLDIVLVNHDGYDVYGYISYSHVAHPKWDDSRRSIRKQLSTNIPMEEITGTHPFDKDYLYRPKDFREGHKWADTLDSADSAYVKNILNILLESDNYYLYYAY